MHAAAAAACTQGTRPLRIIVAGTLGRRAWDVVKSPFERQLAACGTAWSRADLQRTITRPRFPAVPKCGSGIAAQ